MKFSVGEELAIVTEGGAAVHFYEAGTIVTVEKEYEKDGKQNYLVRSEEFSQIVYQDDVVAYCGV